MTFAARKTAEAWIDGLPAMRRYGLPWSDRRQVPGYIAAVLIFVAAHLLGLKLEAALPEGLPFSTFVPAILITTYVFGVWQGLLTAVLSAVANHYYFVPPLLSWELTPGKLISQAFFIFTVGVYIGAIHMMNGALLTANKLRREAARQAEHEQLVARELDHRIKNLFAVVTSVVKLSARQGDSAEQVSDDAIERIMALSRSHGALLRMGNQDDATVQSIARLTLEPFMVSSRERITIGGSPQILDIRVCQVLTLVLHELATNSSKHGALRSAGGRVDLSCESQDNGQLLITWRETFLGIDPGIDDHKGFGTELAERLMRGIGGDFARTVSGDELIVAISLPPGGEPAAAGD